MSNNDERLITIEATLLIQKGQIEILLGLLVSTMGPGRLKDYLECVAQSPDFGDSAKLAAKEILSHLDKVGIPC